MVDKPVRMMVQRLYLLCGVYSRQGILQGCVMSNCVKLRKFFGLLALISAVLLLSLPAFPQGDTGRILCAVTDKSGVYIAGAPVAVTDVARGVTQNLITDSDGAYVALNLVAGTYSVRVEVKGFKTFDRKNIQIEVGKDLRV